MFEASEQNHKWGTEQLFFFFYMNRKYMYYILTLYTCTLRLYTALHFFQILCYSLIPELMKFIFFIFANVLKKKKIYILQPSPWSSKSSSGASCFHWSCLRCFYSLFGNTVLWTWFGKAHTCLYKVPQLTVHVRVQTKHEVKGIVCRPPRQDCLEEQIWGRVQKKFCCFEGPNEHSGLHHP